MNYSFFHYLGHPGRRTGPYTGPDKALGYPALASIAKLAPDFFVGTGDNVYYDHPGHRGRAQTQHEMRKKHHEQYSQPRFLELFRSVATYWMKDDHDHRFDDSDAINPVRIRAPKQQTYYPKTNIYPLESGSGFLPSHELGLRIFREQLPVVDPADPKPRTYRTHRVSKDLQVWFVEGRDYRSPLDMPDGPDKTIWGAEQKAWLERTLLESDATFKLLVSPTPMVGPDSAEKRDNHTDINGYRHEGDSFFDWLAESGISPEQFFIACGDRHWQYHAIRPDGYEEFSSGALIDENAIVGSFPGDAGTTDPEGLIRQPHHPREFTGGFLIIGVQPEAEAAVATFDYYDEHGERLYHHEKRRRR
jgi:alkaline phosphatase/alkaline phosphatase D